MDRPYRLLMENGRQGGTEMTGEQIGSLPMTLKSHLSLMMLAMGKRNHAVVRIRNSGFSTPKLENAKVVLKSEFSPLVTYSDV